LCERAAGGRLDAHIAIFLFSKVKTFKEMDAFGETRDNLKQTEPVLRLFIAGAVVASIGVNI